jgi:hypothetical protein
MGLITSLIEAKSQKDLQSKTTAINGLGALVKDPNTPDDVREWAANGIADMASDHLGGGAGQKGKGGSGGGGKSANAGGQKQSVFHELLSGLVTGAKGVGRAADSLNPTRPSAGMRQEMQKIGDTRPGKLTLTSDERQQLQERQDRAEGAIKQELAVKQQAALAQQRRVDDQAADDAAAKEADKLGLVGDQRLEFIAQHKITPELKTNASEKVYLKGPDGKTIIARRDPKQPGKVFNIAGRELDSSQYTETDKEPSEGQDVAPLRSKEERLRVEHPDWTPEQVKLEAAKALDKDEAAKAKANETRLNITVQNAANQNTPIAPDSLKTLAEEWVDSGGTISIPLSYRGPQRAKLADAIAKTIEDRKAAGNDTTLIEQRYKNQQLQELTKLKPQIDAGVAATTKEIDRAKFLARAVPATSFKKFNNLMQLVNSEVTDDPDLAAFREALVAARSRYNAMITNMRSGGGTATNQIRTETLDEVLSRQMAPQALQRALDEMKIGIGNVKSGYEDTIKQYREQRTEGTGGGTSGGAQSDPLGILK